VQSFAHRQHALIGRRIAGWKRLYRRFVDEGVLPGSKNLPFSFDPVVQLQARMMASLHVKFIRPPPDSFFE
jgi:hypothetical protein